MFTNNLVNSNSVTPKFFADFRSLLEWYPMTTHSSPCFCNKVLPTPSLDVSLLSRNNPSGVGAFRIGGFMNNFLISLKAFLASSVHLNFLAFFYKSYIGISNLWRLGKKDDRKLTIPQKALVCLRVLGDSKFIMASHLSFNEA